MSKNQTIARRQVILGMAAMGLTWYATPKQPLSAQKDRLASRTSNAAPTPSQTPGPFYPTRDRADKDMDLTRIEGHSQRARGEVIRIYGQVVDISGQPLEGVRVEIWQANKFGRYAHDRERNPAPLDEHFQGWGAISTAGNGRFGFLTIKPGTYPAANGWMRPPHVHFKLTKPGFRELITQMYFAGEPLNGIDRILQTLNQQERAQLIVEFLSRNYPKEVSIKEGFFKIVLSAQERQTSAPLP